MKKIIKCIAMLLCCTILSACTSPTFMSRNIEDFLRVPQADPKQSAVQKGLVSYLGETMQLKYPRGGSEMTPFIVRDFDDDGVDEAAVLYTTQSKGKNVHLAILEKISDTWEVTYELEGLSTEVEYVEIAKLDTNCLGLVIGYAGATLTDKYLAVYSYKDETVNRLLEQSYTRYMLTQLSDKGTNELFIITRGALSLQLAGMVNGEYKIRQSIPLDERLVSCEGLYCGKNANGAGIVVDGLLATGSLASQFFSYENDVLIAHDKVGDENLFDKTRRFQKRLLSYDIDTDGSIEIPRVTSAINTLATTKRFYYVTWQDFMLDSPNKSTGIYDALYGYYIRLPETWPDKLTLIDDSTSDGNWQLLDSEGNTYLSARIASPKASSGAYKQVAELGEKRLLLFFGNRCSIYEKSEILSNVIVP